MDRLEQIVGEEVEKYAGTGRGIGLRLYFLKNEQKSVYAVNAISEPLNEDEYDNLAGVVVLARVVGDRVIIEDDATDKPLVDALVQRGVPRNQIVLVYAGEPIPEGV